MGETLNKNGWIEKNIPRFRLKIYDGISTGEICVSFYRRSVLRLRSIDDNGIN